MERIQTVRRTKNVYRAQSRRERKKQETRQRLLECAWQLFQEKGYDDTTVEDITEAADVAKGTFFNYFETKQAILDEIALWRIELLGNHVLAADDIPESAVARIKLMMKAMSDEFRATKGCTRELTRHLFMARISAPIKHESAHRLGSLMQELVRQGQARGEIRDDIDAGLIARLLMTCFFHSLAGRHRHDTRHRDGCRDEDRAQGAVPLDQVRPRLMDSVDALMDGLGGPEWRKA